MEDADDLTCYPDRASASGTTHEDGYASLSLGCHFASCDKDNTEDESASSFVSASLQYRQK